MALQRRRCIYGGEGGPALPKASTAAAQFSMSYALGMDRQDAETNLLHRSNRRLSQYKYVLGKELHRASVVTKRLGRFVISILPSAVFWTSVIIDV